jgi:hypothetical protein
MCPGRPADVRSKGREGGSSRLKHKVTGSWNPLGNHVASRNWHGRGPAWRGRLAAARKWATTPRGKRNLALIRLMYDLGLRRGEVVRSTWRTSTWRRGRWRSSARGSPSGCR